MGQEQKVARVLEECELTEAPAARRIKALDELPRGHFVRDPVLGTAKADVAVRLADGRLLALECKVSNSAVNSIKRLNRETGGKAERWRTLYGQQVITGAVLAGVFKVGNLVDAQDAGVYLFWEHELGPLEKFIRATTKVRATPRRQRGRAER